MLTKLGMKKAKNKYGFHSSSQDNSQTTEHDSPDSSNLKHSVSSASSTNAHFLTTHNYLQPPPPASNQYSQLLSNSSGISTSSTRLNSSSSINLSRKPTHGKADAGIIRVYIPSDSSNEAKFTNYKSLIANSSSTTSDILQQSLQKYNINMTTIASYALYDVVGTVVTLSSQVDDPNIPTEQFMELYARVLTETEKPLFIEKLWSPKDGYVRRFELRKSIIQQQHQGLTQQQQVNMAAEAMQRQAADVNNNTTANVSDTTTVSTTSGLLRIDEKRPTSTGQSDSGNEITEISNNSNNSNRLKNHSLNNNSLNNNSLKSSSDEAENSIGKPPPTTASPYLLTIRGSTQIKTQLNPQKEILIGSCTRSPCDLILNHPSVLAKHCIIGYVRTSGDDKDKINNTSEEDDDNSSRKLYSSGSDSANCSRGGKNSVDKVRKGGSSEGFGKNEVWLRRAMAGAKLSVNNKVINDKQIWSVLSSGDILTIGQEFTCILVDPAKNEDGFNLQGRISQAMKYQEQNSDACSLLSVQEKVEANASSTNPSLDEGSRNDYGQSNQHHFNTHNSNNPNLQTEQPYLLTVQGSDRLKVYLSPFKPFLIGRDKNSTDLQISNSAVKPVHAVLSYWDDKFDTKLREKHPLEHGPGVWLKIAHSDNFKLNNRELSERETGDSKYGDLNYSSSYSSFRDSIFGDLKLDNSKWTKLRPGDILSFGCANFYTCVLVEPGKPTNLQQRVEVAKRYIYDIQQTTKPPPLPLKRTKKANNNNNDTDGGTSNEIDQVDSLNDDEDAEKLIEEKMAGVNRNNLEDQDHNIEIPVEPQMQHSMPYLLTIQGSDNMRTYLDAKQLKIGRDTSFCKLSINHSSILSHHATIRYIRLLGSGKNSGIHPSKASDISIRPAVLGARIKINNKTISGGKQQQAANELNNPGKQDLQIGDHTSWTKLANGDIVSFGDSSFFTCVIVDPMSRNEKKNSGKMSGIDNGIERTASGDSSGSEYLPFAPSEFQPSDPENSTDVIRYEDTRNIDLNTLIPEFNLAPTGTGGEKALLDWIFGQISSEKAGSGPLSAALLLAGCKSAINQYGVSRYVQLLNSVADKMTDYTQHFTTEVQARIKSAENDENLNSLVQAQSALPLVNKILHFAAFCSDFAQMCTTYLLEIFKTDEILSAEIEEIHVNFMPLFHNLLQELIISTIIRLIPILEMSVSELFYSTKTSADQNTLSRLFVSIQRINESAKLPSRYQKHIISSLMSNFSLCLFEAILLNVDIRSVNAGKLVENKLERLAAWFAANTGLESTVRKYSVLATNLAIVLMYGEQVATEASSCFTKHELSMILGKTGSGDTQETLFVITARREKLERAVRRIPAFSFEERPVLDIGEIFGKAKLKRKIRQMKAFSERTISSSSNDCLKGEKHGVEQKSKSQFLNQQMKDQQIKNQQIKDQQMKDQHIKDHQIINQQIKAQQIIEKLENSESTKIPTKLPTKFSPLPSQNQNLNNSQNNLNFESPSFQHNFAKGVGPGSTLIPTSVADFISSDTEMKTITGVHRFDPSYKYQNDSDCSSMDGPADGNYHARNKLPGRLNKDPSSEDPDMENNDARNFDSDTSAGNSDYDLSLDDTTVNPGASLPEDNFDDDLASICETVDLTIADDLGDSPDIMMVRLARDSASQRNTPLGLGLVSGMHTRLQLNGVYVKTLVPGALAALDGNLSIGDRIAAVNGVSIVAMSYEQSITLIKNCQSDELRLLVIRGKPGFGRLVCQAI